MLKRAVILCIGEPGRRELLLGQILDFFGVPYQLLNVCAVTQSMEDVRPYAAFGSIQAVASVLNQLHENHFVLPASIYAYGPEEGTQISDSLQTIFQGADLALVEPPRGPVSIRISAVEEITGAMAGLNFSTELKPHDSVIAIKRSEEESNFTTIISAGKAPIFVRFSREGIPVFFCASSEMTDINQRVSRNFYDVKDQFCSVVPLVMFIRKFFPEVGWGPQELGACLIIDDPLLRAQYGFCNFAKLRDLMRNQGFTTNIAFIPWNWWRTSCRGSKLIRSESKYFSVSIHGCDHTGGEFGTSSPDALDAGARLAQARMRKHELRTGVRHESVMVFPQGVFSSSCPEVLKRNQYLAAVNTEINPVDSQNAKTRIRDVWETAIEAYGDFPIFTRRYPFHGLENFAFDLLLGKPCLIVAHHDYFKDGGADLTELIGKLKKSCRELQWRSLGDVIRRACRRRIQVDGTEEIEMYGNVLVVDNPTAHPVTVNIRKKNSQGDLISDVLCDEKSISWTTDDGYVLFGHTICADAESYFQIVYGRMADSVNVKRSFGYGLRVAARRVLSEARDEYLSKVRRSFSVRNMKNCSNSSIH